MYKNTYRQRLFEILLVQHIQIIAIITYILLMERANVIKLQNNGY